MKVDTTDQVGFKNANAGRLVVTPGSTVARRTTTCKRKYPPLPPVFPPCAPLCSNFTVAGSTPDGYHITMSGFTAPVACYQASTHYWNQLIFFNPISIFDARNTTTNPCRYDCYQPGTNSYNQWFNSVCVGAPTSSLTDSVDFHLDFGLRFCNVTNAHFQATAFPAPPYDAGTTLEFDGYDLSPVGWPGWTHASCVPFFDA
jgi:hypothetical protein